MAEGSIADWLEGAPRGGAAPSVAEGAAPPGGGGAQDPGFWRPDVEAAERDERSRRLWRLAAVAWAVIIVGGAVALAAARLSGGAPDPVPAAAQEPAAASAQRSGESTAAPAGVDSAQVASGTPAAPAAGEATDDGRSGALAALAVRLAVTAEEDAARYVDLAHPEAVERHGDVTVVTVTTVVLEGRDGRWETVRPARYGVALREGADGPVLLGPPWPLAPPTAALPEPEEAEPVEDPDLASAIAGALVAAGWGEPEAVALLPAGSDGLLRARVTATAPAEPEPRTHDVWLEAGDPLRVAGSPR